MPGDCQDHPLFAPDQPSPEFILPLLRHHQHHSRHGRGPRELGQETRTSTDCAEHRMMTNTSAAIEAIKAHSQGHTWQEYRARQTIELLARGQSTYTALENTQYHHSSVGPESWQDPSARQTLARLLRLRIVPRKLPCFREIARRHSPVIGRDVLEPIVQDEELGGVGKVAISSTLPLQPDVPAHIAADVPARERGRREGQWQPEPIERCTHAGQSDHVMQSDAGQLYADRHYASCHAWERDIGPHVAGEPASPYDEFDTIFEPGIIRSWDLETAVEGEGAVRQLQEGMRA